MSTSTASGTAAREAWALFWRLFTADKPRRMATLNELGLAPMQAMALMQLRPGEPVPISGRGPGRTYFAVRLGDLRGGGDRRLVGGTGRRRSCRRKGMQGAPMHR